MVMNSSRKKTQRGLTHKGIEIVQRMNELGMIIDVSHGSDALVNDVLQYTDLLLLLAILMHAKFIPTIVTYQMILLKK